MNSTEPLPCPFCGAAPKVDRQEPTDATGTAWCFIACRSCSARPHVGGSSSMRYWDGWYDRQCYVECNTEQETKDKAYQSALQAWNTRTPPSF
jgi:hypothetical protein